MFSFALRPRASLLLAHQTQAQMLLCPMRFVSRQTRINRRMRKYRADKIQKESSFNKQEGKCLSLSQ